MVDDAMTRTHLHARVGTTVLALMLTLLAACSQSSQDSPAVFAFGHVHGLGLNPATGDLWIATHDGLVILDDGQARRVDQVPHDLMGFTVTGPDEFAASGHPATVDEVNPMGLVTTIDAGRTLRPVSLTGQADLHAIDVSGSRVVAYDSVSQSVLESNDAGRTFAPLADLTAIDVAIAADGSVLFTGADHTLRQVSDGRTRQIMAAPPLAFIDGDSTLAGISPTGLVWASKDGQSWKGRGELPGQPQALSASDGRWFAATTDGIFESTDDGATWEALL